MCCGSALVLPCVIFCKTDLLKHVQSMKSRSWFYEGPKYTKHSMWQIRKYFLLWFLGLVFIVSNNPSSGTYQSKLSPLYVENKFGFISRIWSKNFWRRDIWKKTLRPKVVKFCPVSYKWQHAPNFGSSCNFTSSGSLNTMNGPSNSGLGVYSKSSISCEIISLLHIK